MIEGRLNDTIELIATQPETPVVKETNLSGRRRMFGKSLAHGEQGCFSLPFIVVQWWDATRVNQESIHLEALGIVKTNY